MSIICYAEIKEQMDRETLSASLSQLPERMQARISAYKDAHASQLRLQGQLLIMEILKEFGLEDKYSWGDLKYTAYNRPYFDSNIDFNISHSGNIVVCAGTIDGRIGMDIEQLKNIDIEQLKSEFCEAEWTNISNHASPGNEACRLWTRKEAVLKATGKGMLEQPSLIDATKREVAYENETYYLQEVFVKESYVASLATNRADDQIKMMAKD